MLFSMSDMWHSLGLPTHPALGKILAQSSREGGRETNAGNDKIRDQRPGPECKESRMCCPLLPQMKERSLKLERFLSTCKWPVCHQNLSPSSESPQMKS